MTIRPSLVAFQDFLLFGPSELPDKDMPGSALLWHELRIIQTMYKTWEAKQQEQAGEGSDPDPEELELKEDGSGWQAPPPLKGNHRFQTPSADRFGGGGGAET